MLRKLALGVCISVGITAFAQPSWAGKWVYAYSGSTSEIYDFDVGGGDPRGELFFMHSAGQPAYYDGNTACAHGPWNSLTIEHTGECDFGVGGTFPHGHAERVAIGGVSPSLYYDYEFVATAEGQLWAYSGYFDQNYWFLAASLPAGLPTGFGSHGYLKLVYETINNSTGVPTPNPIWLLGSDHHIYHLTGPSGGGLVGNTWVDVSNANGLGAVGQLSYSKMINSIICTWSNGTSAMYNESDQTWYYITQAAPVNLNTFGIEHDGSPTDGVQTFNSDLAAGGLFQAWYVDPPASPDGNFTSEFVVGLWPNWYSIATNPAIGGFPAITSASAINTGQVGSWYYYTNGRLESIDVGNGLDQETPITMEEGSYMTMNSSFAPYYYGIHDTGYHDLMWVLTDALRLYFYED